MRSPPPSACCPSAKPSCTVQTRPPTRSRASTTTIVAPAAMSSRAAARPAKPAPATSTDTPSSDRTLSLYSEHVTRTRHSALGTGHRHSAPALGTRHRYVIYTPSMLVVLAFAAMSYAHPEQLVDTDWVAAHANDANVRVVDMRQSGFDA